MGIVKDLTGQRFDRWFVEFRVNNDKHGNARYQCLCDCGNRGVVTGTVLISGRSRSCGCYKIDQLAKRSYKHGESGIDNGRYRNPTRLYRIWTGIIKRCNNPSVQEYDKYGGRGISVCDEWRNDYSLFKEWAEHNGYNDNLSIDRIDNNGNYCPENCRWITFREQMNNTSKNRLIEFNGKKQTMSEWALETNIPYSTIKSRLNYLHWPIERALTEPSNRTNKGV